MNLKDKLDKWSEAGLLSASQIQAIMAHEKSHQGNRWRSGVMMTGLFAILLGIALIVASNWEHISAAVKLTGHFALNMTAAALVWTWRNDKTHQTHMEIAGLVLFGLTLTLIALIGQIFQLQGSVEGLLKFWCLISTPFVLLFLKSRYAISVWALLVTYTVFMVAADWIEWIPKEMQFWATHFLQGIIPMGIVLLSYADKVKAHIHKHIGMLATFSKAYVIITTSLATFLLYDHHRYYTHTTMTWILVIALCLPTSLALWWFGKKWLKEKSEDTGWVDIIMLSTAFALLMTSFLPFGGNWIAAAAFILYWLILGALWQQEGWARGVSFAITVVSCRLFVIFFELFGTQLMTGFGLIITGFLLMGLVKLARLADKNLRERAQGNA